MGQGFFAGQKLHREQRQGNLAKLSLPSLTEMHCIVGRIPKPDGDSDSDDDGDGDGDGNFVGTRGA